LKVPWPKQKSPPSHHVTAYLRQHTSYLEKTPYRPFIARFFLRYWKGLIFKYRGEYTPRKEPESQKHQAQPGQDLEDEAPLLRGGGKTLIL
jgi:hypothetical protein